MNTADFSVLQDELADSLNPLRRGANRARAFCASLTGMALPWSGSASGPRMRATRMPARWPFPPAPTPEEVAISPAAGGPAAGGPAAGAPAVDTPASVSAPAAAPAPAAVPVALGARDHSIGDAKAQPIANQLTMKAMITDVVLVLAWGAMIPGLMWLGVAGGF
ncbi:MAG: hypothetical protein K0S02_392 [Achromobacter mucicolens]|jgi:hypothetical protein|uniref:hypothetical protein n=1 Tax=Achromobacter mucicolens TaxID=1389922 RepID=UPI0024327867|nr:hypothetical protein [Achromobacter mucicolens]MDF2860120.1 hypothetical protein [Achromobacter mucicolens]